MAYVFGGKEADYCGVLDDSDSKVIELMGVLEHLGLYGFKGGVLIIANREIQGAHPPSIDEIQETAGWLVGGIKDGRYNGRKPSYTNPGHHDPTSPNFRGGGAGKTSTLPRNAEELYAHAIPEPDGQTWWARDQNGVYHRYQGGRGQPVHWNGSSASPRTRPPQYIINRFEKQQ